MGLCERIFAPSFTRPVSTAVLRLSRVQEWTCTRAIPCTTSLATPTQPPLAAFVLRSESYVTDNRRNIPSAHTHLLPPLLPPAPAPLPCLDAVCVSVCISRRHLRRAQRRHDRNVSLHNHQVWLVYHATSSIVFRLQYSLSNSVPHPCILRVAIASRVSVACHRHQ
jgi:hypothetical protein